MHRHIITIFLLSLFFCGSQGLPHFEVLILSIDNPAGTLSNGTSCSKFGFIGVGCNNILYAGVSSNFTKKPINTYSAQINSKYEKKVDNLNVLVKDVNTAGNVEFTGFTLKIYLNLVEDSLQLIDGYEIQMNTTETSGVGTYTSQRPGTLPTTITFAWTTDIPPPSAFTTLAPETTTEFTGSTVPPTTTPKLPVDCSEIDGLIESGNQTVYPDGLTPVGVYCDVTSYGVLTVIQSRDSNSVDVFNQTYNVYIGQFGNPLKISNYWLGLENMYQLTNKKSYNLLIDLCCGTSLVARQLYHNFQIGSSSTSYTLNASADIVGIGLDYSNNGKDIGAPFSTHDTYKQSSNKVTCDEFDYDDDAGTTLTPYGGWWYGSCGNNLNGALLPDGNTNGTCSITSYKGELGVNLRTTTGTNSDGWDVDLVSYNRVRMAVFTFDTLLVDKTDASFCQ